MFLLAGCAQQSVSNAPLLPLGDFSLGHNVTIASKARKGPISRSATADQWETGMEKAISDRFGRYDGEGTYHFGISVEGYMLAPGGVPVIYSPKSALIINVTVWDDDAGRKLNDKPHQMTIFEDTTQKSFVLGSGNIRDVQQQIDGMAENAAEQIEKWLAEQHEVNRWFTPDAVFNPPPIEKPVEER
ncbi:MAG: hypothetical protein OIF47_01440 [Marinibacterium sp.]|nr:hypothetical protein [Marinibacterium sp.]